MKNKKILKEILEDCNLENASLLDALEDLNFDSLSSINLMSLMSNDYDIEVDPDEIEKLKTLQDLDDFISQKLS